MVLERSDKDNETERVEARTLAERKNDERQRQRREKEGGPSATSEEGEPSADEAKGGAITKIPRSSTPQQKTRTIAQLKEQLIKVGLPTTGKKAELVERLKQYEEGGIPSNVEESDDERDEALDDALGGIRDEARGDDFQVSDEASDASHEDEPVRDVRARNPRRERRGPTTTQRPVYNVASLFTIKDVEGSISSFSGDDKLSIEKWIDEFEDTAALLQWNDLQKVIYAKKLLNGSAKQYIALQKGIKSWKLMKRKLVDEFETKVNSATVHSQLSRRRRIPSETPRQYIYAMSTIASQGDVEEEAVMQYIIDGIPGEESQKAMLYNAGSLTELRKYLERYDRMKEKTDAKAPRGQPKPKPKEVTKEDYSAKRKGEKSTRCFVCGSDEHLARNCPRKDEGPKCFKCNRFGHIAAKCTERTKTNGDSEKSVNIVTQLATDDEITVELNHVKISDDGHGHDADVVKTQ